MFLIIIILKDATYNSLLLPNIDNSRRKGVGFGEKVAVAFGDTMGSLDGLVVCNDDGDDSRSMKPVGMP